MGDIFDVSIIELPSARYRATVNQNCDIAVPELGVLKLGRCTLAHAKAELRGFIRSRLRKEGEVYVALAQGKTACVTVGGQVAKPGTYTLSGTLRLLDAIRAANNSEVPSLSEYDYRAVECRLGDSVASLDLLRAIFAGADTANPYLYPGMHIVLRRYIQRVFLFGAVRGPMIGLFPIREGETLAEFISLLTLDASADSNRIMVQSGQTETDKVTRTYTLAEAQGVVLSDLDGVTIVPKPDYPRVTLVSVRGEVLRSTTVPIHAAKTTVREAIDMCGGPTEWADMSRIAIVRYSKLLSRTLREGAQANSVQEIPKTVALTVRPEVGTSFERLNVLNDYIVIPLGDKGLETPVEAEDHIIVPRKDAFVYVSGSVRRPGAYLVAPGKGYRYYIEQAGGYSLRGSRENTYAMAQYGPAVQIKPPQEVVAGDILVVPDREENKFLRTLFLPILQAVATTVAAVVAIVSVSTR